MNRNQLEGEFIFNSELWVCLKFIQDKKKKSKTVMTSYLKGLDVNIEEKMFILVDVY